MSFAIAIFLISAATLGLELVLVRALSIGHWHHLSFMVISTALLGFGTGGTLITIGAKRLMGKHKMTLCLVAFAFALTIPIVFKISQTVPLDELQLIWDSRQTIYLFAYYILFSIPFLFAGLFIALTFTVRADKAHSLYFYNMIGSGFGAAVTVTMMYWLSVEQLLIAMSLIALLAALVSASGLSRHRLAAAVICAAAWFLLFSLTGLFRPQIKLCQNKSLVYYRAVPGAKTLAMANSPLGRLDCIQAPSIRYFPGLSIGYQGQLPRQILIISDADGISAVNKFEHLSDLDCYKHTTSALAYHLIGEPNVCIIGAGGGSDVAQALAHRAHKVTAVEMNRQIINLLRNEFSEFTSDLYRRADVQIVIAEGRSFLQTTPELFDIINISLLDSFSASAAGVYALNESHLYTVQALQQALTRLQPKGILSVTRSVRIPPRDSLKMLATIAQALRNRGAKDPTKHIIMIRSWSTATIAASAQPFSDSQITNVRSFAQKNSFDLVHLPEIEPDQANQYHVLPEPLYYQSARQILSSEAEAFYRDYAYNIRPATDDKPYFFDFFKWKSLPYMIRTMGRQWLPFSQLGYLLLVATLAQATAISVILILLPLRIAKPIRAVKARKFATVIYFLLLGLAYMFLEMGFIQKLTLLIGHPVFGIAVTLTGFLIFSGCGSLTSGRLLKNINKRAINNPKLSTVTIIRIAIIAIVALGIAELVVLSSLFDWLIGFSQPFRLMWGLAIIAPLAFFMGVPFPSALKQLHVHSRSLVPWAWGINGFASVTGAVLGTFLAISTGFTALVFVALACYFLAAVVSKQICT